MQQRVDLSIRFIEVGALERYKSIGEPYDRMIRLQQRELVRMLFRGFHVSAAQSELGEGAERAGLPRSSSWARE